MIKSKRLVSTFLIVNFLFNFSASCVEKKNSSIKSLDDNTISAKEKFKSLEKNINCKSLNDLTKQELQTLYRSCKKALTEEEKNVFATKFAAIFSPILFGSLFLLCEYYQNKAEKKFYSLRALEYKDVTDQTVIYQEDNSYNCFAIDSKKAIRTDIKCYTDAIKYFGNRKTCNFLFGSLQPWPSEIQKKTLEYLRLSGTLGWSLEDTSVKRTEIDKPDAYLISALAKLTLDFFSEGKSINYGFLLDLKDEMLELSSSLISVTSIGDVNIYAFTFSNNNIKGKYIICHNKNDNKIIILPQYDHFYYYVLDINSHINGHSEYPSLSRFFIYDDFKDKTVIKSIHVPSAEKVQKIFDQSD